MIILPAGSSRCPVILTLFDEFIVVIKKAALEKQMNSLEDMDRSGGSLMAEKFLKN